MSHHLFTQSLNLHCSTDTIVGTLTYGLQDTLGLLPRLEVTPLSRLTVYPLRLYCGLDWDLPTHPQLVLFDYPLPTKAVFLDSVCVLMWGYGTVRLPSPSRVSPREG